MEVKIGDIIIPGPNNGLGRGKFKVLYIYPDPCLCGQLTRIANEHS
jgi:hypothetical protein